MFAPLFFRGTISILVAGLVGGSRTLRHSLFLAFIGIEAALSLVEGWSSRRSGALPSRRPEVPPEELSFVLIGKWYLLVRTVYQIAVLAWFAWQTRSSLVIPTAWSGVGATLMIGGVALRGWSMVVLGERFRGFEVKREARGLETTGPYAIVRHPGYLALALIDLGMPLLLSVPELTVLFLAPAALVLRRISLEDRLLAATYRDGYQTYAARTRRILPYVY